MKNEYKLEGCTVYIKAKCKGTEVYILIDPDDLIKVTAFKNTWHVRKMKSGTMYAYGQTWEGRKAINVEMHRFIMNAPQDMDVDHIDGNGLDNRKLNLRNVPHSVNMNNMKLTKANRSGVAGVGWFKQYNQWRARTVWQGKEHHLGYFDDKEEAVQAVRHFKELHGIVHRG